MATAASLKSVRAGKSGSVIVQWGDKTSDEYVSLQALQSDVASFVAANAKMLCLAYVLARSSDLSALPAQRTLTIDFAKANPLAVS